MASFKIVGAGVVGFGPGVIQALVYFVGHQPQSMPARKFQQLTLLVNRRHPAQGIGGRGVKQHARARRDRGFQSREIDLIAIAHQRLRNLDGHGIGHGDVGRAVGPGGRQHQRFIAGIEHATNGEVQRLHAGRGDHDLARCVDFHRVQLLIIAREGFAQRRQAGVFGVEREAVRHGLLRGALDELGRRQVGFAEVELQHAVHGHGDFGQFANTRMRHGQRRGGDRRTQFCDWTRHPRRSPMWER